VTAATMTQNDDSYINVWIAALGYVLTAPLMTLNYYYFVTHNRN
jgi:hypothetical protein